MCHFNCALTDGGSLHEVITLMLVNVGPPLEYWAKSFYDTGLDLKSYILPPSKTFGNMKTTD